jgi:hypothetical protein
MIVTRIAVPVVFLILAVSGCSTAPPTTVDAVSPRTDRGATSADPSKILQITDISLPQDSKINGDASFVIGADDRWLGRVVLRSPLTTAETYGHFFSDMPSKGWTLLSAVQGKVSSLVFSHDARIATIQVEGSALASGATVTIVVTPRQ